MHTSRGVTLVELVVALGLASVVCAAAGTALVTARTVAGHARDEAIGVAMAGAGLEAVLAAADPPGAPADALWADQAGLVDYLDDTGRVIGADAALRAGAAYVRRRWVRREPAGPGELVVAAVVVAPIVVADRLGVIDDGFEPPAGVVVRRGARMRLPS
jgi:hypothetical protein